MFAVGQKVGALNPKYKDGTRLRRHPADDRDFNGVWVPNDTEVTVLAIHAQSNDPKSEYFVEVKKADGGTGWIKSKNLTTNIRVTGIAVGVVTSEIVTPDPEYVAGMKIYGCGIKEDPIPGQKFGKGVQHLISSQWLSAISEFVGAHVPQLQAFASHAKKSADETPGYDYVYFTNIANQLFNRADSLGLRTAEAMEYFLMATWLIMAASEVDQFPFYKYSKDERAQQRAQFYKMYETVSGAGNGEHAGHDNAGLLGKFAVPCSRRDLLPPIAMERLGINNELSSLKYKDPEQPMREGFMVSKRIDSLKRHFEGVHRRLVDEDHIIHLLWNMHAIYHVCVVFPDKNDLIDYSAVAKGQAPPPRQVRYLPTTSLEKITQRQLSVTSVSKLDWNEGAIPPPESVTKALIQFTQDASGSYLKWYPHLAGGEKLRNAIACYAGCIVENVVVTNGSDEALTLLCHTFLHGNGKKVLAPVPTYEHMCVNVVAAGAELIRLDANAPDGSGNPFENNVDSIVTAIEVDHPEMLYLVSPNNPTGVVWNADTVKGLASRFPKLLIIVDEAYHEFAPVDPKTGKPTTCASLVSDFPNVVVTRTFSKAFCLAAVRCGYLIGHPNTVERTLSHYNPKSVNQFAQIAAHGALAEFDTYYLPYITTTNAAREAFIEQLRAANVDARSAGGGNFACIHTGVGNEAPLASRLEAEEIFVRDISGRFPGYVRVTIGLDMTRVASKIIQVMQSMGLLA